MSGYTGEEVEEMVQEAVAKTERSFGGTFKRLKSEKEDLKARFETIEAEYTAAKKEMELRIAEFESELEDKGKHISELAVQGELQRQLRESDFVPERFVNIKSIEYSDDADKLKADVAEAVENGRQEFEKVLSDFGISTQRIARLPGNPTNPPSRDSKTAFDMRRAEARDALNDMTRRGLLR